MRRGAREPRVRLVPDFGSSAGQEAVDLAASTGLFLDPWQQDVLVGALGERPDGRWTASQVALIVGRQNGKNSVLEARELAGLLLFGEQMIVHTAHELKTSLEAFRRIERLFLNTDDLRRRVKRISHTNGSEAIELLNGARLKFVARSKASGRGLTGDTVILDEAYELSAGQMDALMPTLSARPNPQIWYTSSPPLDRTTGAQLFNVRRRALSGTADRLAYFDFGADGHLGDLSEIDLDDRDLWAATNPAYGIRVSEEFVVQERQTLTDAGFARERLCIWPDDPEGGWAVVGRFEWETAADVSEAPAGPMAFGLEVEWDREWSAIGVAWRRRDRLRQVALTRGEDVDVRRGTGWVVPRAVELTKRWQPCVFVIDPGGPAGSLVDDLEAAGVEVTKMTTREATQAFGNLYDGLAGKDVTARDVRHGNQPELNGAVAGALKRPVADAWLWDRRNSAGIFAPLGAVTGALWGLNHLPDAGPPNLW